MEKADQIILHDSVVNQYRYNPDDSTLCFLLELCNFMQPRYEEGDPENICGRLIFSGVRDRSSDPEAARADWRNAGAQILNASLTPNESGEYEVEMVLQVSDYIKNSENIIVLRFRAEDAEWIPELPEIVMNDHQDCELFIIA
jgi:hypothetical protein